MIVQWRDDDQILVNWDTTIIAGWEAVTAGWESVTASWESVLAAWEARLHAVVGKISLASESILWGQCNDHASGSAAAP